MRVNVVPAWTVTEPFLCRAREGQKRVSEALKLELDMVVGGWELNLGPLQEHQVLLITELSFQSQENHPLLLLSGKLCGKGRIQHLCLEHKRH